MGKSLLVRIPNLQVCPQTFAPHSHLDIDQVCDPHRIQTLAKARQAKDPDHPGCVVYSIGSNGDFTFEMGVEKEVGPGVCEFHIFDMGSYGLRAQHSGLTRVKYHQWGLTGSDGTPVLDGMLRDAGKPPLVQNKANKFYTLQETVKELGHDKLDKIDIFVSCLISLTKYRILRPRYVPQPLLIPPSLLLWPEN